MPAPVKMSLTTQANSDPDGFPPPFVRVGPARLYLGHVTDALAALPARSVQCCVTSPPYFGLRDYKTGTWEGGDPACDHVNPTQHQKQGATSQRTGRTNVEAQRNETFKDVCGKCGARRTDRQIGSEPLHDCGTWARADGPGWPTCGGCFVCSMVGTFRAVRRVLRDDGVLWLNLGDSYASGGRKGHGTRVGLKQQTNRGSNGTADPDRVDAGLPSGNLVGAPWRTALALQADGWVLRQALPWVKRNPMPESVDNRPTKSREDWFMLTKRMGYFFDMEAVRKRMSEGSVARYERPFGVGEKGAEQRKLSGSAVGFPETDGARSFRDSDLWFQSVDPPFGLVGVGDELVGLDVTTGSGYTGAHYATYPEKLIEPLIRSSTSERGACAVCGSPWTRIVETDSPSKEFNVGTDMTGGAAVTANPQTSKGMHRQNGGVFSTAVTKGWLPSCECRGKLVRENVARPRAVALAMPGHSGAASDGVAGRFDPNALDPEVTVSRVRYESDLPLDGHPVRPCVCLDPFVGSGTTGAVCVRLGLEFVGIDLSEPYLREHAAKRIGEAVLRQRGPGELAAPAVKAARM